VITVELKCLDPLTLSFTRALSFKKEFTVQAAKRHNSRAMDDKVCPASYFLTIFIFISKPILFRFLALPPLALSLVAFPSSL
jgi:hypothetical protein